MFFGGGDECGLQETMGLMMIIVDMTALCYVFSDNVPVESYILSLMPV